jgi:transitional endoplasmic reticulum ATPase
MIMLPLLHGDLFEKIGAKPTAGGIILAGPPGTGKTLLARAVAGECHAHIEIVSGPEPLSQWVGETERGLRKIFRRAKKREPSIILFDEIDSIAPRRSSHNSVRNSFVAQLLTLLDGLENRGQIFIIGTTNRPDDVDPALRRPGRFDRVIWMAAPDQAGRAAIFRQHISDFRLATDLDPAVFAAELASVTEGLTGADIAHLCRQATLYCVKASVNNKGENEAIAIHREHFETALRAMHLGEQIQPFFLSENRSSKTTQEYSTG